MVPPPIGNQNTMGDLGFPPDGHVHQGVELQAPPTTSTTPPFRTPGNVSGISMDALSTIWTGDLYTFPPYTLTQSGAPQTSAEALHGDSDFPRLASATMVPASAGDAGGLAHPSPKLVKATPSPRYTDSTPGVCRAGQHCRRFFWRHSGDETMARTLKNTSLQSGKPSVLGVKLGIPLHSKQM